MSASSKWADNFIFNLRKVAGSVTSIVRNINGDYSYRDYEKTIKEHGLNGFGKATVTVVIDGKKYTGDLKET